MYKQILVPVDGSPTAQRGLQEAIRLAKATGAKLRIVTIVNELVISTEYITAQYYESMIASLREAGTKVLEEAASATRAAGVAFEQKAIEIIGGRVADEILRQAKEWPADLIVMGTHGRRGLSRLVMGSDAEIVLRASVVPVLMVRDKPEAG